MTNLDETILQGNSIWQLILTHINRGQPCKIEVFLSGMLLNYDLANRLQIFFDSNFYNFGN
jgi:hypothetical protein